MGWSAGLKVAGADIPNIFKAGIYYQEDNSSSGMSAIPRKPLLLI
jgi:hypothetical protein